MALSQPVFDLHGKLSRYKAKFDALISGHLHRSRHPARPGMTLAQFEPARYDDPKMRAPRPSRSSWRADPALTGVAGGGRHRDRRHDAHRPLRPSARFGREPAVARPDREQIPHLCRGRADAIGIAGTIEAVGDLENLGSVRKLMDLLRQRRGAARPSVGCWPRRAVDVLSACVTGAQAGDGICR